MLLRACAALQEYPWQCLQLWSIRRPSAQFQPQLLSVSNAFPIGIVLVLPFETSHKRRGYWRKSVQTEAFHRCLRPNCAVEIAERAASLPQRAKHVEAIFFRMRQQAAAFYPREQAAAFYP